MARPYFEAKKCAERQKSQKFEPAKKFEPNTKSPGKNQKFSKAMLKHSACSLKAMATDCWAQGSRFESQTFFLCFLTPSFVAPRHTTKFVTPTTRPRVLVSHTTRSSLFVTPRHPTRSFSRRDRLYPSFYFFSGILFQFYNTLKYVLRGRYGGYS